MARARAEDGNPGLPVTLMVRPEHIRCSPTPIEGPNGFAGKVTTSVFKGAVSEVLVTLTSGRQLTAVSPEPLAPGAAVWLQIHPVDLVALELE